MEHINIENYASATFTSFKLQVNEILLFFAQLVSKITTARILVKISTIYVAEIPEEI